VEFALLNESFGLVTGDGWSDKGPVELTEDGIVRLHAGEKLRVQGIYKL